MTDEAIERLSRRLAGEILLPRDATYDEARRIHNGLIDKHPALIVRPKTVNDVVMAVESGRDSGLELSVRGGGHNVAGKAVTEGGLMIDLSLMKEVRVDPVARTISAQGGVRWGELNAAGHVHGLATTGGVISTTGIAGLTLGGGAGWTMGKYGMAIDNLLSAEIVLASGEVVTASEDTDADLFWAIRGGGGNFGVAASLTYRAYPLETVLGGPVLYSLGDAATVLRSYRDFVAVIPDELTAYAVFRTAPDGSGRRVLMVPVCHVGEPLVAEREVKPVREFGPPLRDMVERMPYPVMNTLLDGAFPTGASYYWKSAFFADLTDTAIDTMVRAFEEAPTTTCFLVVECYSGAVTRIQSTATAFPHRSSGFDLVIISEWTATEDAQSCVSWTRGTFDALRPYMSDRVYVNYLDADDGERVRAAYGPNYDRLRQLKQRYDPDNLFRLNQNIKP